MMSGIFEIIQHQSQIYAAQKNDPSFHCTIEDYMVFVGILCFLGIALIRGKNCIGVYIPTLIVQLLGKPCPKTGSWH